MNKPKVAIVYHYFAHYRSTIVKSLIASNNADFHFFSDSKSDGSIKCMSESEFEGQWTKLKNINLGPFLWQWGLFTKVLLSKNSTVILLGNINFISNWVFLLLAKLANKKVYMWTHGTLKVESGLKRRLRVLYYNLCNGLLLYGNKAKRNLREMGVRNNVSLDVVYNSLDYSLSSRLVNRSKLKEKKLESTNTKFKYDLIFCGRIIQGRGLSQLFESIKKLNKNGISLSTVVIGSGPYLDELKRKIADLSLGNQVEFVGAIYEEEKLIEYFAASKCFILPGDIGLSAIHAVTYYTPVITHDNDDRHKPEYEALTKDVNFLPYKYSNCESLTKQIEIVSKSKLYTSEFFTQCDNTMKQKYNAQMQEKLICEAILK